MIYPKNINVIADWEDDGYAGISSFTCSCGNDLVNQEPGYVQTIGDNEVVNCLKCNKEYQFTWIGMQIMEKKK